MVVGRKGKKRQEQIVTEALSLIREGGIQALTMRKVADVVGINEASAYRYFPDKTALLIAIIEKIQGDLLGPMKQILGSELDPETKLQEVVTFHLQFVNNSGGLPLVFMAEIASGNQRDLVRPIRAIIGGYQEILEKLVSDIVGVDAKPSPNEIATLLFGMATAVAIQSRLGIANPAHQEMSGSLLPFVVNSLDKVDRTGRTKNED